SLLQSFSVTFPFLTKAISEKLLCEQKGASIEEVDYADYAVILCEGESLHPYALAHLVSALKSTGADLAYADSEEEKDKKPLFRPAWDEDLFWALDYLGPFVVTRAVYENVPKKEDESYAGYRVRIVKKAQEMGGICHLPLLLSTSLPLPSDTKRKSALETWLSPLNATIADGNVPGSSRVLWPHTHLPPVTVIIPTKDRPDLLRACLASLQSTSYPKMDILLLDNDTKDKDALSLLKKARKQPNTTVLTYPGPFNYAAINNYAAHHAKGTLLCFLNNDTEILAKDWLTEMARLLMGQDDRVGCVGAKLLWPNGLTQHAGVVVGTHQLAAHIGNDWLRDEAGYLGTNQLVCQKSAVTAACLLTPKKLFEDLGGFDEHRFPVAFNDVDYCLRVRSKGKKILWTPFATLLHRESASRGEDTSPMDSARMQKEIRFFRKLWGNYQDPFYNPNLPLSTVIDPFDGLAVPPRARLAR
ncbi:MAG: glycosyltransferase family 2 protein, partial [Desulfovibrio sp.]|nr:glycosyltransferase family 2 protein [Desulfovibrio sp.]